MRQFTICLFVALLMISLHSFAKEPIRVACIGNSITYGAFIQNREKNCYPAQLQYYLGNGFEVKNFGASGTTVLSKGDSPYMQTKEYKESLAYQPDIVLIGLGTNDTKPQNWVHKDDFIADYQSLIDSYRQLDVHPRIILLTPIRCFLPNDAAIKSHQIEKDIRPMIETLTWNNNLEIINLFNLQGDQWSSHLLPDQLHPSSIGTGIMAKKIHEYLTLTAATPKRTVEQTLKLEHAKRFNFHGHQGYEFENEGTQCLIVKPAIEAIGKPWIIRARFWGHEPQTDIALLENGFHIAYCDVADLYGSDEAVARWNRFYKRMVKAGFNREVVLEGMSRGGLIVYNWAAQNPEKVACIYADAPVMNFKSWPMGKGTSAGSPNDTQKLFSAYKFDNETDAMAWNRNPIDCASVIAKAKIPVIHVVGDADQTVPVAENTTLFEKRMKELNAPITVIHKPGVDHHPHSLNNPETIVHFILTAMGRKKNPCTHAVPGNEFRSAAGWVNGNDWQSVAEDICNTLSGKRLKVLLLGNSITQAWGGNRKAITTQAGREALDNAIGKNQWENAGISGDRTQNLLWRIRHDNYNRCHPEYVIIAIGINNLIGGQDSPEEVAEGIIAVANEACKQFPGSKIILLGLYPSGKESDHPIRLKCNEIHQILSLHKFKRADYVNPTQWLVDSQQALKEECYSKDYIHLTSAGYKVLATQIAALINKK